MTCRVYPNPLQHFDIGRQIVSSDGGILRPIIPVAQLCCIFMKLVRPEVGNFRGRHRTTLACKRSDRSRTKGVGIRRLCCDEIALGWNMLADQVCCPLRNVFGAEPRTDVLMCTAPVVIENCWCTADVVQKSCCDHDVVAVIVSGLLCSLQRVL